MIERGLNVVECIIGVNCIGGTVVAISRSSTRANCEAGDVGGGEVGFEEVPCACCWCVGVPFDEGLAVEARELDGHDGPVHHLVQCERWRGNDGGHVAILEAVEEGFDGIVAVPWCCKCRVVGLAFSRSRNTVGGTERK